MQFMEKGPGRFDFFVSYAGEDRGWAEWIAWELEEAGFSTRLQHWDFLPGGSFPAEMHEALRSSDRTLAVLSPSYLESYYAAREWQAVFAEGKDGEQKLVPVRVKECEPDGLLRSVICIDLIGADEERARSLLLDRLRKGRLKPATPPVFPAAGGSPAPGPVPAFPVAQIERRIAPAAIEVDWTDGQWSAFVLDAEIWLVEARDSELGFRRFGDHARKRTMDLESSIVGLALSNCASALALQTRKGVRVAHLDERGLLGGWTASADVSGRSARLLALRDEGGEWGPEILLGSARETFTLDPRARVPRRQVVCSASASCAAAFAGTYLIVSSAGRVIRGRNVLEEPDSWIDVDCAKGATAELIAGIRSVDGRTVLTAVRQDRGGSEAREVDLPDDAGRVCVARTPSYRDKPSRLIVQTGNGDLAAWAWSDLPATERIDR
jgi:TIR domain.